MFLKVKQFGGIHSSWLFVPVYTRFNA